MAKFKNVFGEKKGGVSYKLTKGEHANETVTLLTPAGKRSKFQAELKQDKHLTSSGVVKTMDRINRRTGEVHTIERPLTDCQRAYRQGYINAQNESRAIYAKTHAQKK